MSEGSGASKTKRRYTGELKSQVLSECESPDASIAQVALRHGINANLVHNWRAAQGSNTPAEPPLVIPLILVTPASGAFAEPEPPLAEVKGEAGIEIALHDAWLIVGAGDDPKLLRRVIRIRHETLG